ncbi:hypothetical protein N7478_008921 [Penicillium angulare]|uniref:uncharacterized protein n=1 Tax=Penicillium angulare TaxID=116970 RepID=UPI002541030E|nr:uncharacterized protein N7478_008921 [Penicillium angulare]KAJ5273796.1 hypothetical protein N7478_008921 [Penicillium angulare]
MWDENDTSYLVIKRWLTEEFREELFLHTKRIREGKVLTDNKDRTEEGNKGIEKEGLYMVRKKPKRDKIREQAEADSRYEHEIGDGLRRADRYGRREQEETTKAQEEGKNEHEKASYGGYGGRRTTQAKTTYDEAKTDAIKVHRKHLLPETLLAYNLPWDWDEEDSNYIIIKKWITEDFQEELFAHTRRIREGRLLDEDSHEVLTEQESTLQELLPKRNYKYLPSTCCQCEATLTSDVSLKHSAVKRSADEHRNPAVRGSFSRQIDVVSSRMPGYGKTVLYKADTTEDKHEDPQFSWIHAEREMRDFDEFIRFASSVSSLTDEDRALVLSLMKKVRVKVHAPRCAAPNHVFRVIRKLDRRTKSLGRYHVGYQSNRKRDLDQVVQKMKLFPAGHVVHVPELWAVIVNFQYIITSAPVSLLEETSSSYEILTPPAATSRSSLMDICVLDPRKRLFCFPIGLCKTFYALRHTIAENCLPPRLKEKGYDFELLTADKVVIKADDWVKITSTRTSIGFRIHVRLLFPESKNDPTADDDLIIVEEELTETSDDEESTTAEEREGKEKEKGKREGSMAGEDNPSSWALLKYNRPVEREVESAVDSRTKTQVVRLGKRQMQPITSISGVVVNKKSDNTPKLIESNIYYDPAAPAAAPRSDGVPSESSAQKVQTEEEPRSIQRATTFGSLLDGPSTSSDEKKTELSLEFPSVFTWSTRKKPVIGEEPTSGAVPDLADISPLPAGEIKEASVPINVNWNENENEDTIRDVSSHIHRQLLEEGAETSRAIYKAATISSHSEVDQAIRQELKILLPGLIATGRQLKAPTDDPWWEKSMKDSIGSMCRLLNFFMPLEFSCDVANRFWGGIHALFTMVPKMCDSAKMTELTERTQRRRMTEAYFIVDLSDEKFADLRRETDMKQLYEDIDDCPRCGRGRRFSTRAEALEHLSASHFAVPLAGPSVQQQDTSYQSAWVMTYGEYLTFICRTDVQKILQQLQEHLTILEEMALQIQHGVSEKGKFDRDTYRIPSGLVDAFQYLLMTVVTAAHMVKSIHVDREAYADPDPPVSFLPFRDLYKVTQFGAQAEASMEKAENDIVLMTHTGEISDVVTYEVVSPSLVLALVMDEIHCRDSNNSPVNMLDVYRSYMQTLVCPNILCIDSKIFMEVTLANLVSASDQQYKAIRNPRRRLLQDIYLFQEELVMTYKILETQIDTLNNYRNVLRPSSFRITTESRASSFNLEVVQLEKLIDRLDADFEAIEDLTEDIESLATMTRNGVDVRQEDQGKTILVFTIVTVVFTPLSFVTSYLGMNTTDIRNMTNTQTLFWAVSIPLTMLIIITVLFVAFQAERLREAIEVLFQPRYSQTEPPLSDLHGRMYEEDLDAALEKSAERKSWRSRWAGRRSPEDWRSESDLTLKV